jgi:hypothetical protein
MVERPAIVREALRAVYRSTEDVARRRASADPEAKEEDR